MEYVGLYIKSILKAFLSLDEYPTHLYLHKTISTEMAKLVTNDYKYGVNQTYRVKFEATDELKMITIFNQWDNSTVCVIEVTDNSSVGWHDYLTQPNLSSYENWYNAWLNRLYG